MVNAILQEIVLTPLYDAGNNEISSIYFGGGTPSILPVDEIGQLLKALGQKFTILPDAEITLEANPDDINATKLQEWRSIGINRLSVGIQSFQQEELAWMNRAHNAAEARACIAAIKTAGFTDFSIDLIYGSPLLSNTHWQENVAFVTDQQVPHISCYALTVEPGTALNKMIAQHKKQPVDAEKQAEQFLLLMQWMEAAGYEHYEISNFSRPGKRSKHNSSYWQGSKYYGFGPAAHAFDGTSRKWNISNNALYIQSIKNGRIPSEEELLTAVQQLNEYIMTSLRTTDGLDLARVTNAFGKTYSDQLLKASHKWELGKKLEHTANKLVLTKEGKLFADGIAADLFFE